MFHGTLGTGLGPGSLDTDCCCSPSSLQAAVVEAVAAATAAAVAEAAAEPRAEAAAAASACWHL